MRNDKDVSHLLGWFVAACVSGLLLLFVFEVGWSDIVCSEGESCVREWVSALGGWIGAIATGASILYLAQQVREAQRQTFLSLQRDARKMKLIAERAIRAANAVLVNIDFIEVVIESALKKDRDVDDIFNDFYSTIVIIMNRISDPVFDEFELISNSVDSIVSIRGGIKFYKEAADIIDDAKKNSVPFFEEKFFQFLSIQNIAVYKLYFNDVNNACLRIVNGSSD